MEATESATFLFSTNPANHILIMLGVAVVPMIAISMTSYIKVSVIFSILRSAFGAGQIPTITISNILTLLISVYIAQPVIIESIEKFKSTQKGTAITRALHSFQPFLTFIDKNTLESEKEFFKDLDCRRKKQSAQCKTEVVDDMDVSLKILAFISSELRSAFTLGLKICAPFLIIDIVVSTLLTALGMMMVSPVTITVPLKLMLFIFSDGWSLLISHLVSMYKV